VRTRMMSGVIDKPVMKMLTGIQAGGS
jgi:hypothetical protein